ncbi:G-protein coupled receptor 35-like [Ambystoma mexicanum]|uniref:G-protein coupled receptor 35-like n=1 Tax=Ambystoma mexicanum TaxID=8296 RepID=UPI0037E7962E
MPQTNCSNLTMADTVKLFQVIVFVPTLFFGLAFNGLALWVFCCKFKQWTETRVYMLNLIISDCSLLFTFPFRLYAYNHPWNLGKGMCDTLLFIFFLNNYMSILIITMVAVDRYMAIKHPLKSKRWRSPAKAAGLCILAWLILIAFRTYLLVHDSQQPTKRNSQSCFLRNFTRPKKRALYFTIFGFILPFIILSFCSLQVIRTLRRNMHTSPDSATSVRKAIKVVAANLAIFVACFLPAHIGTLVRFGAESSPSAPCSLIQAVHTYEHITLCLASLNCCLDAICYYFVAKEFWEASHLQLSLKSAQLPRNTTQDSSL